MYIPNKHILEPDKASPKPKAFGRQGATDDAYAVAYLSERFMCLTISSRCPRMRYVLTY